MFSKLDARIKKMIELTEESFFRLSPTLYLSQNDYDSYKVPPDMKILKDYQARRMW